MLLNFTERNFLRSKNLRRASSFRLAFHSVGRYNNSSEDILANVLICSRADIRTPLSLLTHERSRFTAVSGSF